MGRTNRDVGGYRGRRTITDILRFIAIALAVVVVLVLAGVFYLQKYLVYSDDGVRLELPPFLELFRHGEEPEGSAGSVTLPDPEDISLIEQPGGSQSEPEPQSDGAAVTLTVEEVLNGSASARLEELQAEALVLEMKDQMGRLGWSSAERIAGQSGVNGPAEAGEGLSRWNGGEVYTIARVHCFRDDTVPYYRNPLALRWAGNDWNWRDELGLRWTSPAQEEVRAYNAALCGELAAMGFDEIVLEEFYFPIGGKLDTIRRGESYNPSQFTAQVEDFLTRVRAAVEPYGTKISLRVGRSTLEGGETASGVTPQLLEEYAHRIWVEADGQNPAPLDLLEGAGITGGEDRLVLVTHAREDTPLFQAVIPSEEPKN